MLEAIGIGIVVLIWVVSSLIKGFKWLLRQTNPPPPPQAPPPSPQAGFPPQASTQNRAPAQFSAPPASQAAFQAPPPSRPAPGQAIPQQAARLEQAARAEQGRVRPRQPQAGGQAVYAETDRRDFERQEQDLFASEPMGLGVSLASSAARPDMSPNRLFGGTDDLVRAIILQEVLGPPLSRRKPAPAPPRASE